LFATPFYDIILIHEKEFVMNLKRRENRPQIPLMFSIIFGTITLIIFFLPSITSREFHTPSYACLGNLESIGLSLKQYAMDYADYFPPQDNSKGLQKLCSLDYLTDNGIYICPKSKKVKAEGTLTEETCSYVYLGGFKECDNHDIPLAFDKPGNRRNYFNIVFIDGRTERYSTSAANSCETIIIFLNEKFKYPEKLYKRLLEKAKKIDAELKSSN
jgi:hypothetical protein